MTDVTISSVLSDIAPWLITGLTGGPVGLAAKAATTIAGALGLGSSTVNDVTSALGNLVTTPEQKLALEQAENTFKLQMLQAGYKDKESMAKMDLDQIAAVNATMVAELNNSKTESWLQKNWRPLCGISVALGSFFGVVLTGVAFGAAIFFRDAEILTKLPDAVSSIALVLGVPGAAVGIIAWHKGNQEVQDSKNTGVAEVASAS